MMIATFTTGRMRKSKNLGRRAAARGFTLSQVMLVLVIGGVMAVVGYSTFGDGLQKVRNDELIAQVNQITTTARANLGSFGYNGTDTANAISHGVFPEDMVNRATAQVTTNSDGTVSLQDNNSNVPKTGVLTISAVQPVKCAPLVQQTHKSALQITVGTTVVKAAGATDVDQTALTTACGAATPQAIAWVIGR